MNAVVALLGAGGHARSLIGLLESCGWRIQGLYDDSFRPEANEAICGYPLAGNSQMVPAGAQLVLAVGDNRRRAELFTRFKARLYRDPLAHARSFSAADVRVGAANQFFGNVFINSQVALGDNNIINTGAIIEHETCIGSHNHISVGAILCGRVGIGDFCMIGAGATVIDKVSICDNVVVGANSTVVKDIAEPGTYVGSPARKVR